MGVLFAVKDGCLEMIVEDQGSGIAEPSPSEPPTAPLEGGMGMSIIRAIVDELDIHAGADGRGTVVRMIKYLPAI